MSQFKLFIFIKQTKTRQEWKFIMDEVFELIYWWCFFYINLVYQKLFLLVKALVGLSPNNGAVLPWFAKEFI